MLVTALVETACCGTFLPNKERRCTAGKGLGIGIEMGKGSSRGEMENIGKEIAGRDRPENRNE